MRPLEDRAGFEGHDLACTMSYPASAMSFQFAASHHDMTTRKFNKRPVLFSWLRSVETLSGDVFPVLVET